MKINEGPPDEGGPIRFYSFSGNFVLKGVRRVKQRIKRVIRILLPVICFMALYQVGYADGEIDVSQVTGPINTVYTIIAAIISGVGALYALINFVNMLSAIQSHDQTQQISGGIKFGVSILIAIAPWVIQQLL